MRRFKALASACLVAALLACVAREDAQTADTADTGTTAAELSQFAGTWDMVIMPETGDSTLGTFRLVATDDRNGWTITAPNREPVPLRIVDVQGNTITTEAGPFESFLRPGVQVRSRSTMRLQGDRVTGTTEARYDVTTADSVVRVRTMATRVSVAQAGSGRPSGSM